MKLILLTGIPGMGKSHIGDYLRDRYGFYHLDMDDNSAWPKEVPLINIETSSIQTALNKVKTNDKDTVITWGFWPVAHDKNVHEFINNGAQMFWLDGNREIAKNFWKQSRPNDNEVLFDNQIDRIDNEDINRFEHRKLNTFDSNGNHLEEEIIIEKIFELYK